MRIDLDVRMAWRPQQRAAVCSWLSLVVSAVALVGYGFPLLIAMLGIDAHATPMSPADTVMALSPAYQEAAFTTAGILLAAACWLVWCARRPRALDPKLLRQCRRVRFYNRVALRSSAALWLAAIVTVYILPAVRHALG